LLDGAFLHPAAWLFGNHGMHGTEYTEQFCVHPLTNPYIRRCLFNYKTESGFDLEAAAGRGLIPWLPYAAGVPCFPRFRGTLGDFTERVSRKGRTDLTASAQRNLSSIRRCGTACRRTLRDLAFETLRLVRETSV